MRCDAYAYDVESHVVAAASGATTRDLQQVTRGWSGQHWEDASAGLHGRGWIDNRGDLTAAGIEAKHHIENRTDDLTVQPLDVLPSTELGQRLSVLRQSRASDRNDAFASSVIGFLDRSIPSFAP